MQDPEPDSLELDDDHVEIRVEADEDEQEIPLQNKIIIDDTTEDHFNVGFDKNDGNNSFSNDQDQPSAIGMDGNDFSNMMNGFNNMDYNQMMQMMAASGMGNFNSMMGKCRSSHYSMTSWLSYNRDAHGNESNIIRHVWWVWWLQRRHEWYEWYEYGNEFQSQPRNVSWLE